MRKKQEKKDYSAPCCMIIQVSEMTYLMDTSFPSQHKKATHASGPSAYGVMNTLRRVTMTALHHGTTNF